MRCVIRTLLLVVFACVLAGCSLTGGNTLGGRDKCWTDQRAASIWRGILGIDGTSATLSTPEGDVIPLWPGTIGWRMGADGRGELTKGDEVIAHARDDVTLFGGAGSDGFLVVCGLEEIHSA
jgi:hypothetical protein